MSANLEHKVGWAIIGTPDGLQTSNYGCIKNFDLQGIIDLNNLYIKPFPGSEILCLFRENRKGSLIHYFILYKDAKEIRTDRPGTFYGSVLVLVDHTVEAELAIHFLRELAAGAAPLLSPENRFISDLRHVQLPPPASLPELGRKLRPVTNLSVGNREGYISLPGNEEKGLYELINSASEPLVVGAYARIYFSAHKEVLNFVRDRGKFEHINLETIQLKLEQIGLKKQIEQLKTSVLVLQKEKEAIENQLKNTVTTHEKQINGLNVSLQELLGQQQKLLKKGGVHHFVLEKNTQIKALESALLVLQQRDRPESPQTTTPLPRLSMPDFKNPEALMEQLKITGTYVRAAAVSTAGIILNNKPLRVAFGALLLFILVLLALLIRA